MKKEEIFKKAYVSYKELIDVCDEFFESVIRKHYPQIEKESLFAQLDIYLQSILIGVAASDTKFDSSELVFIDQLTDYGNLFSKVAGGVKAFSNADESQLQSLQKMAYKSSKDVPLILQIIAKLDALIKDTNYAEEVLRKMFNIFTCLVAIDDDAKNQETVIAVEMLAPLINLFPKVNLKKFLKK